jgi:four helix bundle protein
MPSHRDLDAWKQGTELAKACYRLTASFPADERFGLVSQIRRAAVSVPTNIAEGCGRHTRGELLRFLSIARGSLKELETLLELSIELGYGTQGELETALALAERISRMLWKWRASVERARPNALTP